MRPMFPNVPEDRGFDSGYIVRTTIITAYQQCTVTCDLNVPHINNEYVYLIEYVHWSNDSDCLDQSVITLIITSGLQRHWK